MTTNYAHDIVVVGYGVSALLWAFDNGSSIVLTKELRPHPFVFCDEETYSRYGFGGNRVCDLYDHLLFDLSMAGRAPLAGRIASIKEGDANKLNVEATRGQGLEVYADEIYYFEPKISESKKIILDWIDVRRGQKHDTKQIETGADFINRVCFYPTERICGSKTSGLKDAVAISYLTQKELQDNNFSEFIVRKKVKYLMEEHGIRGPKNGKDPRDPTKQKYYSIKLESKKREVYPLVISIPEKPTTFSISQDVSPSLGRNWISDFSGTTA